jgi:hypothetical protein
MPTQQPAYTPTNSISPFQRNLIFFNQLLVLANVLTGKKYARYILKVNKQPVPPSVDWQIETPTLQGTLTKRVPGNTAIDSITDENGNIYFDATTELA